MASVLANLWVGRALSSLAIAFLAFDTVIKLLAIPEVTASFIKLGYSPQLALTIGMLELICVALYIWPRTSVLGAIVLTGYLGGAIATHVRVGDPLFSHVMFPTYVAALVWGGLYLRHERLRAFVRSSIGLAAAV